MRVSKKDIIKGTLRSMDALCLEVIQILNEEPASINLEIVEQIREKMKQIKNLTGVAMSYLDKKGRMENQQGEFQWQKQ